MCAYSAEADVPEDADKNMFIKETSEASLKLVDGSTTAQSDHSSRVERQVDHDTYEVGDPDGLNPQPDMSNRAQDAGDASPGIIRSGLDEPSGNGQGTGTPASHDSGLVVEPNNKDSGSQVGVTPLKVFCSDIFIN